MMTRRQALKTALATAAVATLSSVTAQDNRDGRTVNQGLLTPAGNSFTLPPLPYAYDALEPHIDARTMEIHHDKHHKAYVDNLNKAWTGMLWGGPIPTFESGPVSTFELLETRCLTNPQGVRCKSNFTANAARLMQQPRVRHAPANAERHEHHGMCVDHRPQFRPRRRDPDAAVVFADGQVAAGGGRHAVAVDALHGLHDFVAGMKEVGEHKAGWSGRFAIGCRYRR